MKNSLKKQINEVLDDRRSYLILKFWLFVLFVVLCLPSLLATISALGFNGVFLFIAIVVNVGFAYFVCFKIFADD